MLEDAAVGLNGAESGLKTAAVLAALIAEPSLGEASKPRPPGAGWMRDYRERTLVQPSISHLVPRVYAIKFVVRPILLHEQSGNLRRAYCGAQNVVTTNVRAPARSQ
jgi:hypothetical protein